MGPAGVKRMVRERICELVPLINPQGSVVHVHLDLVETRLDQGYKRA